MGQSGSTRVADAGRSGTVLVGVLALVVVSLVGAVISVSGGLSDTYLDAVGPDGHLSVPWPMMLVLVALAVAAGSTRRGVALVASGLVAVALLVAVVSGLFDGGYADDRLTATQRGYQVLLVVVLLGAAGLAATRFVRVWRGPARLR